MKLLYDQIRLAATDVSHHLACHHLTHLELSLARGLRTAPEFRAPDLVVIQQLGLRHEAAYLSFLQASGLQVLNLANTGEEAQILEETRRAMQAGVEVIVQGALAHGRWFGRPDILRRVAKTSTFGPWSYEAYDCKLARETKATTILQLAFYSELLGEIQGGTAESIPEFMWVMPPGADFAGECYRVAEYSAYYRYVKGQLENVCDNGAGAETYPEPCAHCDVCRWFQQCDARRRADDHLSLVAGIRKQQRNQLEAWNAETMAKLAVLPIPLQQRPLHGSTEGIEKVREQARVQVAGRTLGKPMHELLEIVEGSGFYRLPEPSSHDVFLDLEGDPFVREGGHQYLFGFATMGAHGKLVYDKRWAFTVAGEKQAFEWIVDEIVSRWKSSPAMRVYHFGAYEPVTFKRLMGTYATREDEIDSMLRAGLFVDLHTICKQAVRASVEEYSLKKLEPFHGFQRTTALADSREAMRYIEHRLELGWLGEDFPGNFRQALEGYNAEDCFSTAALRDWLEGERAKALIEGAVIPRPVATDGAPPENVNERQERVAALVAKLTQGLPADPAKHSSPQQAQWLLAQLIDWHRREDKANWWEYYRLRDMDDEELLEDRSALGGLQFVERVTLGKIPTDRYSFARQETDVRRGDKLCHGELAVGKVETIDIAKRLVDIKKTARSADVHPNAVFVDGRGPKWEVLAESLFALGEWVSENAIDAPGRYRSARDLLLRNTPRLANGESVTALPAETTVETACRVGAGLDNSLFAIQGPPGAGKTHTGAWMICRMVASGKKVGITALSHKVIRNLLNKVLEVANELEMKSLRCIQKTKDGEQEDTVDGIAIAKTNAEALSALQSGKTQIAAGTGWMWARPEFANAVDVLFVDEAGQMALADVLAAAPAARNLVLIGDPQQLQRPLKGTHPAGAEKSALEHMLAGRKTISPDMGLLLPETWRMHENVTQFTSELFYEGRLRSRDHTRNRVLQGHAWLNGSGLWFVPVKHEGNRNSSPEEVEVIARIVNSLIGCGVQWFRGIDRSKELTIDDVLVVTPYNAQVADLAERLATGARVGTVDKFQGQEAPIVIYSLTTSSPGDAPRGMEFLYSLNRLNVATSRAMSAVVVVGSPKLLEPDCSSPRQMQLANALCRYLELAKIVYPEHV